MRLRKAKERARSYLVAKNTRELAEVFNINARYIHCYEIECESGTHTHCPSVTPAGSSCVIGTNT